jgi:hypothetical protein
LAGSAKSRAVAPINTNSRQAIKHRFFSLIADRIVKPVRFRFLAKQNVPGLSWRKIKASPMTLTPQTVAIPLNAIHNCAEKEKAGIVGRKGSDYLFKWGNYKPK